MKRIPVEKSSFCKSIGFELQSGQPTGTMEVEKLNGSLMSFTNITMDEYLAVKNSVSVGSALQKFIRTKTEDGKMLYPCVTSPAPTKDVKPEDKEAQLG
jgi:hypothetical protein